MLSRDIAKEQIQDRVRLAAHDRVAATAKRMRSPRVGSGMFAAVASLRPRGRSSKKGSIRVARSPV